MFSGTGRRILFGGIRNGQRFFTTGNPKIGGKNLFDDRTLGLLAFLVSVPTAAYIWKYHKSPSKVSSSSILKDLSEPNIINVTPIKKRKVKYLIIGGGTAGFSAIQAIKENDPEAQIVLVSREPVIPYLRPPLSKELWFTEHATVSLDENLERLSFTDWHGNSKPLAFENGKYYQETGVEMILGKEAVDFNLKQRQVSLSDGQILEFDRLLIATGAEPKNLAIPIDNSIKSRLNSFRNVSDFVELYGKLKNSNGKRIVVIGGGFLGSELAVAMSKLGKENDHEIIQVFPEDGHMALVFPKYLSQWTTEKVSKLGVKVKSNRSVSSIEEDDGSKLKLILDNGEELKADHVVVAVGVEPSLMKSFKSILPIDREFDGLEADKFLQVAPGIFAAGDVVSYVDPVLETRRRTEHFDHAVLSGKLAGINMVRYPSELEPYSNQSMFWSDLGPDVGYEAVGLVDSSLTTVGVWARARPIETPKGTELDSSDIRVQPIGQTSISTTEPQISETNEVKEDESIVSAGPMEIEKEIVKSVPEIKTETLESSEISPSYGKGVVFYLKNRKIVGILLFNLFNRVNLAKEILKEGRGVDEVGRCVRLFNVDEVV